MLKNSTHRSKKRVSVNLQLDDGSSINGFLFCSQGERISDLLNDERTFLPVETLTRDVMMLRKGVIRSILVDDENIVRTASTPWEILGISEDATREDIKRAYRQKVTTYHPDKLSSLDLPGDMTDYANDMLSRINTAYEIIMRKIGADAPPEKKPSVTKRSSQ